MVISSLRNTTAEASGLRDILICSVISDVQHDVGYDLFEFVVKS